MALYELGANLKLDFLIGLTLIQVRVGEYQLQLAFDKANISIEDSLSCFSPTVRTLWRCNDRWNRSRDSEDMRAVVELLGFLGKTTTALHRVGPSGLSLLFDEGFGLEIYGEESNYESYQITGYSGGLIVV